MVEFRVCGLGFRVQEPGFRVINLEVRSATRNVSVYGVGSSVNDLASSVEGSGYTLINLEVRSATKNCTSL